VLVTLEFEGIFIFLALDAHFYLFNIFAGERSSCCTTVFGNAIEPTLSLVKRVTSTSSIAPRLEQSLSHYSFIRLTLQQRLVYYTPVFDRI
jgi:hypothetical protein